MRAASSRPRLGGALGALILGAGLLGGSVVGVASPASAHDFLESTTPAADSTVTEALDAVSLTFNEPPFADSGAAIAIRVTDPAGTVVSDGRVQITDATLTTAIAPTTQGGYQVQWQNVSGDGHTVSGEFAFTYEGPAAAGASSSPATAPPTTAPPTPSSTGQASPSSTAPAFSTPQGTTVPADDTGGGGFPGVLVGLITAGAILVLAAIVVIALLVGRRRPGAAATAPRSDEGAGEGPTSGPAGD